jgi:hypothetical protein
MPVLGVRAKAGIGDQHKAIAQLAPKPLERHLDYSVVGSGTTSLSILGLRNPEEKKSANSGISRFQSEAGCSVKVMA